MAARDSNRSDRPGACAVFGRHARIAIPPPSNAESPFTPGKWSSPGTTGRLPLPTDVGDALVTYLRRSRPATALRSLFLTSRAPVRAISSSSIVAVAGNVLRRAGLHGGGHRLRHAAATSMLRRGASLTEIAQVLRHRHLGTTAIYAKVDRDKLRDLAQRWPATASAKPSRSIARK